MDNKQQRVQPEVIESFIIRLNDNQEVRVAINRWPSEEEGKTAREVVDIRRFEKDRETGNFKAGKGITCPLRFEIIDGIQTALAKLKLHCDERKWKPEDEVKTQPVKPAGLENVTAEKLYAAVMADLIDLWADARNNDLEYKELCLQYRKAVSDLVSQHDGHLWNMLNTPMFYESREFPERKVAINAVAEALRGSSAMNITKLVEFVRTQYKDEINSKVYRASQEKQEKQEQEQRLEFVAACRKVTALVETARQFMYEEELETGTNPYAFDGKFTKSQRPAIVAMLDAAKALVKEPLYEDMMTKWGERRRYASLFVAVSKLEDQEPSIEIAREIIYASAEALKMVIHHTTDGREVVGYTIAAAGKKLNRKVNAIVESPKELLAYFDAHKGFMGAAGDLTFKAGDVVELVRIVRNENGKVERIPQFVFDWDQVDFKHVPAEA